MYLLVRLYGETSWTAALLPVSLDGIIAVPSMTLLRDSRQGRSGFLPWALLVTVAPLGRTPRLIRRPQRAFMSAQRRLIGRAKESHTMPPAAMAPSTASRRSLGARGESSEEVRRDRAFELIHSSEEIHTADAATEVDLLGFDFLVDTLFVR
ncbi:hypothetical protein E1264_09830 [Actinomadura sp. KC216]|uniref:DUF2637 domain-containing protein n=1 Tax=Actinomadura sp. KC216 TaxID=2530370 RepID=UPI00104BBE1C|nr:DUF2637 domain-containing protein [Actinomadura sp. KC216]TDB88978.1 hypothetical protein E1264_09830 [Actinomadura sp. KC216]